MLEPDARTNRAERILALAAVPAFATMTVEALAALSERVGIVQVHAHVPLAGSPGKIRILPADAAPAPSGAASSSGLLAPELVPWLAGARRWSREVVPLRSGLAVELDVDTLRGVLRSDFAATLGVVRALSLEVTRAQRSPIVAAELAAAMTWNVGALAPRLEVADRILLLRAALPFARTHVGSLFQLARDTTELRADDGFDLWRPRDASEHAWLLLSGQVASQGADGRVVLAGPGCLVGIFDALLDQPRWSRGSARGPLVALALPVERLLDIVEDEPLVAEALLAAVAAALVLTWRVADG